MKIATNNNTTTIHMSKEERVALMYALVSYDMDGIKIDGLVADLQTTTKTFGTTGLIIKDTDK